MISIAANNIASHLPVIATRDPNRPAVIFPRTHDRLAVAGHQHLTFEQLDIESGFIASGLNAIGIGPGVRTVLMVKPSLEFFAITFALFKSGAVPVLVDPGMGIKNLGQCLEEAQPEAFVGIPKAQFARKLFGWAKGRINKIVTVGRRVGWGGFTLKQIRSLGEQIGKRGLHETQPGETAAILFTSGSTGVPKGAVYTHEIFNAQVDYLRDAFHIEPGEIDLCTFPLFALFAPALEMTSVIPEMDASRPAKADPRKIISAITTFGVTNMFASPALLNNVSIFAEKNDIHLPTLRRVISAGAPVPAKVVERMAKSLRPGVQVFTPYGATEALPVSIIGSDEILGETRQRTDKGAGVCVGRPAQGMDMRIIRISDEPIAEWSAELELAAGETGEITVKGPVVTREYFNRPDSTELAKINDSGGFWHRMGDLGYFDEKGRLWVCGRKAHRVQQSEGTLFTLSCEAVFNTHPAVRRSALVGVGANGQARPVLCVELAPGSWNEEDIGRNILEIAARHEHTVSIKDVLFHHSFPVDVRHNSKIFREKLAEWAAKKLR